MAVGSPFRLGRLFGIPIRVHWTFLLLLGYLLLFGGGLGAVALVLCVFGCVVLHELGHSLVARRFGIGVSDITLLPFGGVARLDSMSWRPGEEFWIAIAGPLVNVGLAALFLPLALAAGAGQVVLGLDLLGSLAVLFSVLLAINVGLAVFNLVPAFPMDGGRILRAWLAKRRGMLAGTTQAATVGRWVALAMAVAGLLLPRPMLLVIALFVYVSGKQEETAVREMHARRPVLAWHPAGGWRYTLAPEPEPVRLRRLTPHELRELLVRAFGESYHRP